MLTTTLDDYREVILDAPDVPVLQIGCIEQELLNRQTGFNRSLLEKNETCGCFHCGRRFPTSLVTDWMVEDGQDDTGVCPYCGTDALIVGTEGIPLSTALLTQLYEEWFKKELENRKSNTHIMAPPYGYRDDYLRKGIPFRLEEIEDDRWADELLSRFRQTLSLLIEQDRDDLEAEEARRSIEREEERAQRESLLEDGGSISIPIWSVGDPGDGRWDCKGTPLPGNVSGLDIDGTWAVSAYEDDEGIEHFELLADTVTLRFSPWNDYGQSMLIELLERYGKRLMGDLTHSENQIINLDVYLRDS